MMHLSSPPGQMPPPNPEMVASPDANQVQIPPGVDLQPIVLHAAHIVFQNRYGGVRTTQNLLLAVLDAVVENGQWALHVPLGQDVYTGCYEVDGKPNIPIAIWDAYQFFLSVRGRAQINLRLRHATEYLTNLAKRSGTGGGTILCLSDKPLGIAPIPGLDKELPLADHLDAAVDFVYNVLRLKLVTAERIREFATDAVDEGETDYLLTQDHVATLHREGQHRTLDLLADDASAAVGVCREAREVMTAIFAVAEAHVRQAGGTILTISSLSSQQQPASESVMH